MMAWKTLGFMAAALLSAGAARAEEAAAKTVDAAAQAVKAADLVAPVVKEPTTGMELVFVKGGCYRMGDAYGDGTSGDGDGLDERPVHEVCLDAFYLGRFEVTQGQWAAVMGRHESTSAACHAADCPVDGVSWDEMQAFVAKLNARGGARYRLPTEAEWEYAARSGGKLERYAGGPDVESVTWYEGTSGMRIDPDAPVAHPVGQKVPNGLGIHDMSGNVYEVTADWYDAAYYAASPRDNPTGPARGERHVKRGGCGSGHPGNTRTTRRSQWDGEPTGVTGLRLLRVP